MELFLESDVKNEIKEILIEMGLGLGLKIEGWPPPDWDPGSRPS